MSLVSVIIPAYNAERTIGACVDSARGQSLRDIEIIVVDDGSNDGTAELVGAMKGTRLIRQGNAGPASARNRGIEAASGEWLAFLDADEEWIEEGKLEAQVACAKRHDAVLVGTTNGRGEDRPVGFRRLLLGNPFVTSTVIATAKSVREVGCFEEGRYHSEDFGLWLRIVAGGGRAVLAGIRGSSNVAGRLNYAAGGLSGDLSLMQKGEEGNFRALREARLLGRSEATNLGWYWAAMGISRVKYLRRLGLRALRDSKDSG